MLAADTSTSVDLLGPQLLAFESLPGLTNWTLDQFSSLKFATTFNESFHFDPEIARVLLQYPSAPRVASPLPIASNLMGEYSS
jgi:hypothetical protein